MTTITVEVEGIPVTGRILIRTPTMMEVELVRPFGRLVDGRYVMAAAQPFVSYAGAYGDDVAESILRDLYRAATWVDLHLAELRQEWSTTLSQLSARSDLIVRSRAEHLEERTKSRRALRAGLIDLNDHQEWMRQLSFDMTEFSLLVADSVDSLLSASGVSMSLSVQAQLMKRVDESFDIDLVVDDAKAFVDDEECSGG